MQVSLCRAMRLQSSNNHLLLKASCQVLQDSLHIFFRQNMPRRDDDEEPLPLEIELLLGVGQGFSSCRYTCRIAKSIVARTTGCSKEVQGMASCAGKNAERNIHTWFERQPWSKLLPTPFEFDINFLKPGGIGTFIGRQTCLLPYEVFDSLYQHAPELFYELFVGKGNNLSHFWRSTQATDPNFFDSHPVLVGADLNRTVPIGMHGDDAGIFQGAEKALVLSWNSVAVAHSTIDNRILFGSILGKKIIPELTLGQFYKVFVWAINVLAIGIFPDSDHNGRKFGPNYFPQRAAKAGQQIAGGFICAWSELRGDTTNWCTNLTPLFWAASHAVSPIHHLQSLPPHLPPRRPTILCYCMPYNTPAHLTHPCPALSYHPPSHTHPARPPIPSFRLALNPPLF